MKSRRCETVHFRVSKSEKTAIQNVSEYRRLTISDYCRYIALKQAKHDVKLSRKKPHPNAKVLSDIRSQINRTIEHPLSRLASIADTKQQLPHRKYLSKIAKDLETLKAQVIKELG